MFWVVAAALALFVIVPPLIAVAEGVRLRAGPRDPGFWMLARTVAGACHVPWGRRGSPIVRFPLPDAEARLRALRAPARRGWTVELRAYQRRSFRFAARVCAPPAPPARWRAPGLAPLELYPEETEHLQGCSLETTDERLLRWLLRHAETRRALDGLLEAAGADAVEVVLAGTVIIVRAQAPRGLAAGAAVEVVGPALVAAVRRLSADLHDLAEALEEAEDLPAAPPCGGCGAPPGEDPAVCRRCGARLHRGCREMVGGCVVPDCPAAPDGVPSGAGPSRATGGA